MITFARRDLSCLIAGIRCHLVHNTMSMHVTSVSGVDSLLCRQLYSHIWSSNIGVCTKLMRVDVERTLLHIWNNENGLRR